MKVSKDWHIMLLSLLEELAPNKDPNIKKIYIKLLNIKWRIEREEKEEQKEEDTKTIKRLLNALIRELHNENE